MFVFVYKFPLFLAATVYEIFSWCVRVFQSLPLEFSFVSDLGFLL